MNRSSWRGLSFEAKSAWAMVAVILVGVGGFFAAAGLTSVTDPVADASDSSGVLVETVTIENAVVKRVRVVRRVTERSGVLGKRVELVTVTTPARIERRLVPVVQRYLVTVPGQRRTIVETRDGRTRTSVVTSERIVTRERVVTNQQLQTVDRPVTTVRVITENVPVTQTLRSTETVRLTDTIRETDTVQVTETTKPVTVTVELPVTVTVTLPPEQP